MMISTEDTELLEGYVEDNDIQTWVVRDEDGDMFEDYGVQGIPDSLLIDKDGKIAFRGHPGRIQEEHIQALLDAE